MASRMWAHGTSVVPEWVGDNLLQVSGATWNSGGSSRNVPWSDINGLPRGWGTTFRGKRAVVTGIGGSLTTGPFNPADPFAFSQKGYWFHFSIPTPAIVTDRINSLFRVLLRWEATPGVAVVAVHVYDGEARVAALGVPARTLAGPRTDVLTLPAPRPLNWSVGLSLGVTFANDGDITFFGAAGDFTI